VAIDIAAKNDWRMQSYSGFGIIRRFLELLKRIFQNERPYAFRHGLKMKNGMSMCQEITIAKIDVQRLADYCMPV